MWVWCCSCRWLPGRHDHRITMCRHTWPGWLDWSDHARLAAKQPESRIGPVGRSSRGIRVKSPGLTVAAAFPALVVAAAFAPAQAAIGSTGWRVVLTKHYGPASNLSAYETVAAPGAGDAWVFGGTSV